MAAGNPRFGDRRGDDVGVLQLAAARPVGAGVAAWGAAGLAGLGAGAAVGLAAAVDVGVAVFAAGFALGRRRQVAPRGLGLVDHALVRPGVLRQGRGWNENERRQQGDENAGTHGQFLPPGAKRDAIALLAAWSRRGHATNDGAIGGTLRHHRNRYTYRSLNNLPPDGRRTGGARDGRFASSRTGQVLPLEFVVGGELRTVTLPCRITATNSDTYAALARLGFGLMQAPRYHYAREAEQGTLVEVLADCPPSPTPISVL
ncbi:MAG: hypothetical protein WDM85_02520 [Caulobacteraceae bacterium]